MALQKLETHGLPTEAFLGVAGMPGLTAYAGLLRIAALKSGDVVFVSGAAGAVGSVVCQIAKLKGHKVVASAGGAEKVKFLTDELGVDVAIDYKATKDLTAALMAAAPEGIDVYFENVGGEHLEAAITAANPFARMALCGMISQYNDTEAGVGTRNMIQCVGKSLRLEGFIVSNHWDMMPAFVKDLAEWHAAGKITWKQTVREGIENAPSAFLGLFAGENFGKMLVKLG
jgi:NADPH-dependent curcumin reductase CurA